MKTNKLIIIPGMLVALTTVSGFVLSAGVIYADDNSVVDTVEVTVNTACTLSSSLGTTAGVTGSTDGEGNNTYTTTLNPDSLKEINGSIISTVCNDSGGYALYAIGYSGDSYDTNNTKMINSASSSDSFDTGVAPASPTSSTPSSWAMKLTGVSGLTPPTIVTDFQNYHVVPATYAQVTSYGSATASESADGATAQAKYQVYISATQAAGTYTGKVKYTMVHPNNAPAPTPPPSMQNLADDKCTTTPTTVVDSRDGEEYLIQRLADDNCWMLDNLRLDLTNSTILNSLTTSNTHVDSASLTSLKSGNRSAGAQYASSGFVKWDSSSSSNVYNQAKANADYKDTTTTSYGEGSDKIGVYYNYCAASAGSYCYDSGAGTGNASYDLCPAGWRMPTGGSSGEYQALYTAYSSDATSFRNALSTPLSGYFDGGSADSQGADGYFWSSTYGDADGMYNLYVSSSYVDPSYYDNRDYGLSVRCLLGS